MDKRKLFSTIAIPLIGGSLVGYFATRKAKKKYRRLDTPDVAPPNWVFPVAWTTLYTTMGFAKYDFDRKNESPSLQNQTNIAYSTQLGLNFLWSLLFFRWNLRGAALAEATLLWSAIAVTTYHFSKKSKLAASLMIPYILWTSYALFLNYKTWEMNRGL